MRRLFFALILLVIAVVAYLATRPRVSRRATDTPAASEPPAQVEVTAPTPRPDPCASAPTPPDAWLSLGGTLVLSVPEESVALFHVKGGPGVPKRVTEIVGDRRYEVASIARKKVCLRLLAGGDIYALTIPESVTGNTLSALGAALGIIEEQPGRFKVPESLLKRELGNLPALLESALALPKFNPSGVFLGFGVERIEPGSLFLSLGLREKDLLTGVNQVDFKTPADGLRAYQEATGAKRIELRMVRDGKPMVLIFDVAG